MIRSAHGRRYIVVSDVIAVTHGVARTRNVVVVAVVASNAPGSELALETERQTDVWVVLSVWKEKKASVIAS